MKMLFSKFRHIVILYVYKMMGEFYNSTADVIKIKFINN